MKNLPKKIYLQIGGSDVTVDKSTTDWNDLFHGAITWAEHRINDNDIEFVLSDVVGRSEQLSCGRNITTCVFYKDGGKCNNPEYCRDQAT